MTTAAFTLAKEIADRLPPATQWGFNATDLEDDAVFCIYAPRETWHAFRILLALPRAEYRFDDTRPGEQSWEEFNLGSLTLSLFTPPEEHDEQSDPA
jgi:hypothetical protein